eukprot:m.299548 g.299548  ORF g.299548 m.299548 type:complete len:73 (-) comp20116_c0_seq1:50-268(-)
MSPSVNFESVVGMNKMSSQFGSRKFIRDQTTPIPVEYALRFPELGAHTSAPDMIQPHGTTYIFLSDLIQGTV